MANDGWIKLHRQLKDKGFYRDSQYVHLWLHILLSANHADVEMFVDGRTTRIKPGSFITSRLKMAADTGVDQNKVERILKFLKTEQQIEQQNLHSCRLISIINWDKYQMIEQPIEQQMNSERTASEQRVNTNKNDKNDKNDKKKD